MENDIEKIANELVECMIRQEDGAGLRIGFQTKPIGPVGGKTIVYFSYALKNYFDKVGDTPKTRDILKQILEKPSQKSSELAQTWYEIVAMWKHSEEMPVTDNELESIKSTKYTLMGQCICEAVWYSPQLEDENKQVKKDTDERRAMYESLTMGTTKMYAVFNEGITLVDLCEATLKSNDEGALALKPEDPPNFDDCKFYKEEADGSIVPTTAKEMGLLSRDESWRHGKTKILTPEQLNMSDYLAFTGLDRKLKLLTTENLENLPFLEIRTTLCR